ncbi:type II secretion system F family protein [Hyphomonas sp.]|uniref:type II secretion system F family protein n=1 Tax=Hyphomonas sp. TaxID=87 RepID=UPI0035276426
MPRYNFRAIDSNAAIVHGTLEAGSRDDAVRTIVAKGQRPLRVEEQTSDLWTELTRQRGTPTRLADKSMLLLMRKLATLTSAGVSIEDALTISSKERRKSAIAVVCQELLARLHDGLSLADALAADRKSFPEQYVAMVRAGEQGGTLPQILTRIADMLERSLETRQAVQSAMIYPAILAVTSTIAMATIFLFVLPSFEPMFAQSNVELPLLTAIVMSISRFFSQYGLWLLLIIALAAFLIAQMHQIEQIRAKWDASVARAPAIGPFLQRSGYGRASAVLGALLVNGVSLDRAMKLTVSVPDNRAFRSSLEKIQREVVDGKRLSDAFEAQTLCPDIVSQLIRAGEHTGEIGKMLIKASEALEQDARNSVDRSMSILTPALTLVLGGFVGVIVFSVLLAVLSINDLAF